MQEVAEFQRDAQSDGGISVSGVTRTKRLRSGIGQRLETVLWMGIYPVSELMLQRQARQARQAQTHPNERIEVALFKLELF